MGTGKADWYTYLSTRTDGACVHVKSDLPGDIAQMTVDLLLTWMGVEKTPSAIGNGQDKDYFAELSYYVSDSEIDSLENESNMSKFPYFSINSRFSWEESENITKVKLTTDVMKEYVPKRTATIPDFAEEITSIINSAPEREMYPCVFHDPTLSFHNKEYGTTDAYNRLISHLTRSELLHIGRCCNPDVLRQFGAILTKLIVVVSAREMPDHISSISADYVAKIPLVPASERYNRLFWKLLLHTIEPGTKLSARPAALLAALSLQLGIVPLMKVSEQEMLAFKDKWNDPSTPSYATMESLSTTPGR